MDEKIKIGFIPVHGGCQKLKSFQMSEIVYDATVRFCSRFIRPGFTRGKKRVFNNVSQCPATSPRLFNTVLPTAATGRSEYNYKNILSQLKSGFDNPIFLRIL
jgi:hypothetical protein